MDLHYTGHVFMEILSYDIVIFPLLLFVSTFRVYTTVVLFVSTFRVYTNVVLFLSTFRVYTNVVLFLSTIRVYINVVLCLYSSCSVTLLILL